MSKFCEKTGGESKRDIPMAFPKKELKKACQ